MAKNGNIFYLLRVSGVDRRKKNSLLIVIRVTHCVAIRVNDKVKCDIFQKVEKKMNRKSRRGCCSLYGALTNGNYRRGLLKVHVNNNSADNKNGGDYRHHEEGTGRTALPLRR